MNSNKIVCDGFSNPDSRRRYESQWPDEPDVAALYQAGRQCGGCSHFAPLNSDYGICCAGGSRHFTESVFEHFTCPSQVDEGWGPHSFSADPQFWCRCQGQPVFEALRAVVAMLQGQSALAEITAQLAVLREYLEAQASED
jgi:hypothetical protein